MEKKKIDWSVDFEQETRTFTDKNGNAVVILKWIPTEEKEAFAREQVENTMATDDELGICYKLMTECEVKTYLLTKYYTDMDVSEVQDVAGFRKLHDYCRMSGLLEAVHAFVSLEDQWDIDHMAKLYWEAIQRLYETEHSIGNKVKQLLDTNPNVNNAETRELIEKLIDMKGALDEKEQQNKVIPFGKKTPASLRTGGVKIDLAKR